MKHIFVLNPAAGKGDAEKKILPQILSAAKKSGVDYEIHRTMHVGDARRFVRSRCTALEGELLRFYAVGGDGTLNEVVNGALRCPNAEIALIPAGTGNDFPRMFSSPKAFLDIAKQIKGKARPMDLIRCNESHFINMLNIGLDCAVVAKTAEIKKNSPLNGSAAYLASLTSSFLANKGCFLTVEFEDGTVEEGEFTLVAVGNGAFCGGGFKGVPQASVDDGLLDVSLIRKVDRKTFLALVRKYHQGTHLNDPKAREIVKYVQCRKVVITSSERLLFCADGELAKAKRIELEILPGAIRFSLPEGVCR